MKTPDFWKKSSFVSSLLLPLAGLYYLGSKIRPIFVKPQSIALPVLCVGNLTAGGAGKTPTVVALIKMLHDLGVKPHVLSRGYKAKLPGPLLVDLESHGSDDVGDEPLLLARHAPVWIGKDRVASAKKALSAGASFLIMDDGFQNPSLSKDRSLLVVDGAYGFGNMRLLPSGPLREPLSLGLERSDALLMIGEPSALTIASTADKKIFKANIVAQDESRQRLQNQKVVAFAGIGLPEKFRRTLQESGADIEAFHAFADHHSFSDNELALLETEAKSSNALLVTTEKDWVRLPKRFQGTVHQLPIELVFEDDAEIGTWLEELLVD